MSEKTSVLIDLAHTLEALPQYAINVIIGTVIAILSDPIITLLAVGSVCLGLLSGLLVGLSVFFLMFAGLRAVNTIANAIGNGGLTLARSVQALRTPLMGGVPPSTDS